jgi:N-methylhydantoinase B/oxoprolinase/acetone carboxylase alpha subunit
MMQDGLTTRYDFSAVRYQMQLYGKDLKDGDVIMTNSPRAGGS